MQPLVDGSEVLMSVRREIPLDALTHCHHSPSTSLGLEKILQSTKMLQSVLSGPQGEQPAERTPACPGWNEENPSANMLKGHLQESSPLGSGRMSLCQHGGVWELGLCPKES